LFKGFGAEYDARLIATWRVRRQVGNELQQE
jgi:hypothetical protein